MLQETIRLWPEKMFPNIQSNNVPELFIRN